MKNRSRTSTWTIGFLLLVASMLGTGCGPSKVNPGYYEAIQFEEAIAPVAFVSIPTTESMSDPDASVENFRDVIVALAPTEDFGNAHDYVEYQKSYEERFFDFHLGSPFGTPEHDQDGLKYLYVIQDVGVDANDSARMWVKYEVEIRRGEETIDTKMSTVVYQPVSYESFLNKMFSSERIEARRLLGGDSFRAGEFCQRVFEVECPEVLRRAPRDDSSHTTNEEENDSEEGSSGETSEFE